MHLAAVAFLAGFSSHARESKTVLDSGFHAVDSGFQVLDSSLCQWNLGCQSLVGFRIPQENVFRIIGNPESGFRIPYKWQFVV